METKAFLQKNLSKYGLNDEEIAKQLDNKTWFIKKLTFFGTLVSSLSFNELHPSVRTNCIFTGLVTIVREFPYFNVRDVLSEPTLQALKPIVIAKCGQAESFLEAHFAKKVIEGAERIQDFMYYDNYELLIKFEIECLKNYLEEKNLDKIKQVAFIGSGPLPLSSIMLTKYLPSLTKLINYDHNEDALNAGKEIVKTLDPFKKMSFILCSGSTIPNLNDVDLVYIAALAGTDLNEKKEVLDNVFNVMKPEALLAARSSTGLRCFIYHPVTKEELSKFKDFRHYNPNNKVIINSFAIARK